MAQEERKGAIKINGYAFNRNAVESCKTFEDFKKKYENVAYVDYDKDGKPICNKEAQAQQLQDAWSVLRPEGDGKTKKA